MYKVFIAEDEHLIRENLRKQILSLSETCPITYAGEAADGEMALASVLELQPDIILSDIRMPFMDGLTFAKEARKILPWTHFIFISGYDDFEYTKGAIQVQADDYLLKPIKPAELKNALLKVVKSLDQQKQSVTSSRDTAIILREVKKNIFLDNLFEGSLEASEILREADELNYAIAGKKMTVLLAVNKCNYSYENYTHFSEYLNYLFEGDENIVFSSVSANYIKFLIFDSKKETVLEKGYQVAHTLIHELEQSKQDDIAAAIGFVVDRLSEVPASFEKCQEMLATYGSFRTEKIISFEDDLREGELSPTHPFKMDLADYSTIKRPINRRTGTINPCQ